MKRFFIDLCEAIFQSRKYRERKLLLDAERQLEQLTENLLLVEAKVILGEETSTEVKMALKTAFENKALAARTIKLRKLMYYKEYGEKL